MCGPYKPVTNFAAPLTYQTHVAVQRQAVAPRAQLACDFHARDVEAFHDLKRERARQQRVLQGALDNKRV